MYVPAHFKPGDAEVLELLAVGRAANLITATERGVDRDDAAAGLRRPEAPARARAMGRVPGARGPQQPSVEGARACGEAMVILRGPDAYISPAWYATKREHGRVVPTWNYITVHAYGRLVIHDDPAWVEANVRRLTDLHERRAPEPWSVDDAPPPYIEGQLRAIVGVEILIDRVEGKWKLSQNRSDADIAGAIEGLEATGEQDVSGAMRDLGRGG